MNEAEKLYDECAVETRRGFDAMAAQFTASLEFVAAWKHNYHGVAYSTRIKAAIADLKDIIAAAESHPEIAPQCEDEGCPHHGTQHICVSRGVS